MQISISFVMSQSFDRGDNLLRSHCTLLSMRGKFDTLFSSKRTFSHTSIHQKIQLIAHHSSNFSNDHKELNLRPPHQANPPQKISSFITIQLWKCSFWCDGLTNNKILNNSHCIYKRKWFFDPCLAHRQPSLAYPWTHYPHRQAFMSCQVKQESKASQGQCAAYKPPGIFQCFHTFWKIKGCHVKCPS